MTCTLLCTVATGAMSIGAHLPPPCPAWVRPLRLGKMWALRWRDQPKSGQERTVRRRIATLVTRIDSEPCTLRSTRIES